MTYKTEKPNFGPGYTPGDRQAKAELPERHTLLDRFDTEMNTLTQRRGMEYGHPSIDFQRAAFIKRATSECPDPRLRHVLDMIATKMARLVQSPEHFDSWLDIAGYARTAIMVIDAAPAEEQDDDC